jgi:hypothetical protein
MTIQLVSPTSYVEKAQRDKERSLDTLKGKKVAYVFNQHGAALAFWKAFEVELENEFHPTSTQPVYKESTWKPAPDDEIRRIVRETDYAVVGVGA